jgi:hypothetical protein
MSCTVPTANINSHRLDRFLFLIQIDKQPHRENVIDTIVRGRMGLNILVHITDFRLISGLNRYPNPTKPRF